VHGQRNLGSVTVKSWLVKFSAVRRDDGSPYSKTLTVNAFGQLEAEDIGLRKCRLLGYRDYKVSAEQIKEA